MTDVEMTEDKEPNYHLSAIIQAHKGTARCLAIDPVGTLISGGHDDYVRFWAKRGGEYQETLKFDQPKAVHVNSLAFHRGSDGWKLFVGRRDGSIAVYVSGNANPVACHKLHSSNVCCLHVDNKNGVLLSGSWDSKVVVSRVEDVVNTSFSALSLEGHTLSVWGLATIEDKPGYYVTASADKTIRLWHDDVSERIFIGHTDVVRSVVVVNKERLLSAANDSTLRMWNMSNGQCLTTLHTLHENFIYSMHRCGNLIVTGSENSFIDFWKLSNADGEAIIVHAQNVELPAASAWSVVPIDDEANEVAAACSDGQIYIFSHDEKNKINPAAQEAIDAALATRRAVELAKREDQASKKVVINVALDDGEANMKLEYTFGTDPANAAEKFIKDHNLPISYLKEITDYIVMNIPEAAAYTRKQQSKPQETQRVTVDGKKYDYAMEVTVDDGRKLQLPYNNGDDPDIVAQQFCEKHNLPIKFFAMVSQLIRRETPANGAAGGNSEFYDPFTGGGRYVPSTGNSGGGAGFADPYTGGGRYVPGASGTSQVGSSSGDPLTSAGRYVPGSTDAQFLPNSSLPVDKKKPRGELVPVPNYFTFGVEQLSAKAIEKLRDMNNLQGEKKLNAEQFAALEQLMGSLPGSVAINDNHRQALELGLEWSIDHILPILDVFRVSLLHKDLNEYFCSGSRGQEVHSRLTALLVSGSTIPIRVLLCRAFANAFAHEAGRTMASRDLNNSATLFTQQLFVDYPSVQLAGMSVLANLSLHLLQQSQKVAELGPREDVLRSIIKALEGVSSYGGRSDAALVRLLQAIVTLMWGDSSVITLAKSRDVTTVVNRIKDAVEDSGKNIARDIIEMVYAV